MDVGGLDLKDKLLATGVFGPKLEAATGEET